MNTCIYSKFKRAFDLVFAIAGLVLLSPLYGIVSLIILIRMGHPIIFKQLRLGKNAVPFYILKFRSMTDKKSTDSKLLPDNERLTSLGIFLRKTSLDELPQLWNIVKGEMSLIGPRPQYIKYSPYFTERERLRFKVLPGITSLPAIKGRNMTSWDYRLELDAQYVEQMSIWLDLKILFKTFWVVIKSEGVSVDSNEVEPALDEARNQKKTEQWLSYSKNSELVNAQINNHLCNYLHQEDL